MPRKVFEEELARLNVELAEMGRRVDASMQGTIQCLKSMDIKLARTIFPRDREINTMEKNIEQSCMNLLALQQPLAHDLRRITAALKVITDMERIADQCADICEILSTVAGMAALRPTARLMQMFEKARGMFSRALDAYLKEDIEQARRVCREDDEVDALFSSTVLELCGQISRSESTVPENVDFMFIAKYIERMGDHATNIAEWAIFIRTGAHPDLNTAQDGENAQGHSKAVPEQDGRQ